MSDETSTCKRIGIVDGWGGGRVDVYVDRDLDEYPENGTVVYVGATGDAIERLMSALTEQVAKNRTLLNRVGNVTRSRQRWVRIARQHGYSGPGPGDRTGPDFDPATQP